MPYMKDHELYIQENMVQIFTQPLYIHVNLGKFLTSSKTLFPL